ncbi:MAG: threonine synthase [Hyphomonadaceae bacterium]
MKYISTRGGAEPVDFVTACLNGLAPDGGLYMPERWPDIAPPKADEPYTVTAARIFAAFSGDAISETDLLAMCERAYASFAHQSVAPLTELGCDVWMMELHHGPTLAFKDVAMQIIAQLYDYALEKSGQRLSIICATSGDTGGAAAAAFAGAKYSDLYILHPHERISPVQRRFMTTTGLANVHNLALDGDFDDCQAIVKSLFADKEFVREVGLSGVNSINWARIVAQTVYYATVQAKLGQDVRFIVPSGNMGDAMAGFVASKCGLLPSAFDCICAVNENDALARILNSGEMKRAPAVSTPSPAMDISVPSNFERVLFEASGRDGDFVRRTYETYAQTGDVNLPDAIVEQFKVQGFAAAKVTNAETKTEMQRVLDETGWLICPHTAVGTFEARRQPSDGLTRVVLATAHAAKFPETVKQVTGRDAGMPERCGDITARTEVFERLPAEVDAVLGYVREHSGKGT